MISIPSHIASHMPIKYFDMMFRETEIDDHTSAVSSDASHHYDYWVTESGVGSENVVVQAHGL